MKKIVLILLSVLTLASCERKHEPNKILDGYVVGTNEVVLPAEATRQFCLLQRDMLRVVVPVINKLSLDSSSFSELTGPVASKYSFQLKEAHYGAATIALEFRDDNNATFDPIAVRASSTTLKSVIITCTGGSPTLLFPTITENFTLVLESSGIVTSTMRMTGTASLSGSGYALNFGIDPAGIKAVFEGVTDGAVSATGTGGTPPASCAINIAYSTDRSANGSIAWEGRDGGIHISDNGSGYVSTAAGRILLQ